MDKLVSVIVPIYNSEKYIARCIESILNQTYKNIEVILINDGSSDKSLEIINYYKSIDNRILVINKKNEGVSIARNYGIEKSNGDYIGFVDSDDHIEENMYEVLVNRIQEDNSEMAVLTSYTINYFDKYRSNYNNTINSDDALKYLLRLSFPTSLWPYLYKREIIKGNCLNKDIHFFEDFEFNFKVIKNTSKISLCDKLLYHYNINEGSINSQGISDKKITCLNIYENIKNDINELNSKYKRNQSIYFRAHFLASIIASLAKSDLDVNTKYYDIVYKNSKKIVRDIILNKEIPFKYRIMILITSINKDLTIIIMKIIMKYKLI